MNALERRPDSSAYAPALPVLTAVAQTIGIKMWPIDPQKLNAVFTVRYQQDVKELEDLIKNRRKKLGKYIGTDLYEEKERDLNIYAEEINAKMEDILINARIVDAKRFKRRERKFGEVPADVIESMGESISETAREIFD